MIQFEDYIEDEGLRSIAVKIKDNRRISPEEGLLLFEKAPLPLLGVIASIVRKKKNGKHIFFNRNFHIEPSNICVYNCRFCSYHRNAGDPESWDLSHDRMLDTVKRFDAKDVTEVHIVGSVHPSHDLHYYGQLIQKIRMHRPGLHIKAFSAVELDYMISKAGISVEEGLLQLKEYGLDSDRKSVV